MKTYKIQTLLKMAREGQIETSYDIKVGHVLQIRWIRTGKYEFVEVVK